MEVGDKPQLSAGILGGHVRGYKTWNQIVTWLVLTRFLCHHGVRSFTDICSRTQYVVMPELYRVVDLCLSEPRLFIPWGEDLDGHILPHPGAPPHLPIPAFACTPSEENVSVQSECKTQQKIRKEGDPPIHSTREICLAMVLWTRYGSPVPLPDVQNSSWIFCR